MNYLVTGAEEHLKHAFIKKLKKELLGTDEPNPVDFELFDGLSRDAVSLAGALKSAPFSAKNRLVVIKSADRLPQKSRDVILKYLESPFKSTTLVVTSDAERPDEFLKNVSKKTRAVRLNTPKGKELESWIKNEFSRHRKKIEDEALLMLASCADTGGLGALKNEIGKISSYAGDKETVEAKDIEAVSHGVPLRSVFELVDTVIAGKPGRALEYLNLLLLTEDKPYGILNGLAWQFRVLARVVSAGKGLSPYKVSRITGVPFKYAGKTIEQAGRFTSKRISECAEYILETDFSIKSGRLPVREALETLMVRLCG